jgi:hypothetical protein
VDPREKPCEKGNFVHPDRETLTAGEPRVVDPEVQIVRVPLPPDSDPDLRATVEGEASHLCDDRVQEDGPAE